MNFAVPAMLWALPLVLVPIIIHLLQRRRFRRVEFSAMDFLLRAVRRTRRRVLLEDILLLILRTLAVLFLILALARPNSEDLPLLLGREPRGEILILDASMSMDHLGDGQSAYAKALSTAAGRLRALDSSLEDRAALIRAGLRVERVASGDPEEVRGVLEELDQADPAKADLIGALHAAVRTAEDLGPLPGRTTVTILTDLQANVWNADSGLPTAFAELAALGCDLEVLDCGASQRENVAVTSMSLSTARLVRGDNCEVLTTLRNFGKEEARVVATLFLDDTPIASETFVLPGDRQEDWNVAVAPVDGGARAIEVRIEHDALVGDDTRAAVLEVGDGLQVVVSGEAAAEQDTPGVYDAMWRYLALGEWAPLRPLATPVNLLDLETLAEADLLLLADPGKIPLRAAEAIHRYVQSGGGLLLALGPRTGQEEVQELLQVFEVHGLTVSNVIQTEDAPARLDIVDPQNPALRFFDDDRWRPLLTEVPHLQFRPLLVDVGLNDQLRIGLRFLMEDEGLDSGAALVDWKAGRGKVAILASAPNLAWNRMEEVPGGTLPLVYDLLFSLAPAPGYATHYDVGAPLSLRFDHPPTDTQLRDPDGVLLAGLAELESLEDGSTRLDLLASVPRPGIWRLSTTLLLPDGEEMPREQPIAVVVPTEESDLRAADPSNLKDLFPNGVRFGLAGDGLSLSEESEQTARDLTRSLLMLVLGLLIAETLFALLLDRRRNL